MNTSAPEVKLKGDASTAPQGGAAAVVYAAGRGLRRDGGELLVADARRRGGGGAVAAKRLLPRAGKAALGSHRAASAGQVSESSRASLSPPVPPGIQWA